MEISFEGKNILVTGAGRGIGRDIAKKLSMCGAEVFALSKTRENLESLKKEDSRIQTICVDITDWNATREALDGLPAMDGLVNNAAIAILGPFLEVKPEEIDTLMYVKGNCFSPPAPKISKEETDALKMLKKIRIFNVNVKSVINVSQSVARKMIARNEGGSIVNISSQASMAALGNHALYCSTKGALDALSRVMALELGLNKIRVNCINPTVVMTEMGRLGWSEPSKAQTMLSKIPLRRFAEVEEVVDVVLFLLSEKAAMINGVSLPVDGGFLAC